MPVIEIEIDENGKVSADFLGFKGLDCKRAEQELIKMLKDLSVKKTGETLKPGAQHEKRKVTR